MRCVAKHEHYFSEDESGYWDCTRWKTYFCPVCSKVTLEQETEVCYEVDEKGNTVPSYTVLYPSVTTDSKTPVNVRKAFEAALKVKNIDGAICLLSLRRTLEMICKDKGAKKGTLFVKLQQLARTGVLPPILDQMAEVLKNLGNMAAHADNKEFSTELVSSMVEFTETILDYVYVLPAKLSAIQVQFSRSTSSATVDEE